MCATPSKSSLTLRVFWSVPPLCSCLLFCFFNTHKMTPVQSVDLYTVKKEELDFNSPFQVRVERDDFCHALVAYFTIEFSKSHTRLFFSTSPRSQYTHWKQTVFYLEEPYPCKAGDVIEGNIRVKVCSLSLFVNVCFVRACFCSLSVVACSVLLCIVMILKMCCSPCVFLAQFQEPSRHRHSGGHHSEQCHTRQTHPNQGLPVAMSGCSPFVRCVEH